MRKLNDKQKRFAAEYIRDLNMTQAAIRAGYSDKTAYAIGSKLLKKVEIKELIKKKMDERARRTEITADMVVQELAKHAFCNPKAFYNDNGKLKDVKDIPDEAVVALSSIDVGEESDIGQTTKIRLSDKLKALELLGKHLGIFDEKGSLLTGIVPLVITPVYGAPEEEEDEKNM